MKDSQGLVRRDRNERKDQPNHTAEVPKWAGKAGRQREPETKVSTQEPETRAWIRLGATQLLFLPWMANSVCYVLCMLSKALARSCILCVLYINPLLALPFDSINPNWFESILQAKNREEHVKKK